MNSQVVFHKVGHRGAPREFPANTLRSFSRAMEYGCTMVECDIRAAADGELVLAHDPEAAAGGKRYAITEHDSAFLARLDLGAGEGVPKLSALATLLKDRCAIMADMKCEGGDIERKVIEALSSLSVESKLVPGAGTESRKRFRETDSSLPLSLSLGAFQMKESEFEEILSNLDTQAVTWEHPLLTSERISALHSRGVAVYAWTVDDFPTMLRLQEMGVDGIISNRCDLLAKL